MKTSDNVPGLNQQVCQVSKTLNGHWILQYSADCTHDKESRIFAWRAGSFPELGGLSGAVSITGCALAFLYGGFHVLAWNSQFPSDTQQLLWRISACVVAGGWACFFTLYLLFILVLNASDSSKKGPGWWIVKRFWDVSERVLMTLMILTLLAYISARIYLVIDCFVQLFHLEPGAFFEQPRWLAYVPHFG